MIDKKVIYANVWDLADATKSYSRVVITDDGIAIQVNSSQPLNEIWNEAIKQ